MATPNGFNFNRDASLVIKQGASAHRAVRVPADLTGYTARMEIARRYKDTPVLQLTTDNGGLSIAPDTEESIIEITATAAQTAQIPDNFSGVYSLEIISASGQVTRLLPGFEGSDRVTVRPDVAI
jgi:hypothetical protein